MLIARGELTMVAGTQTVNVPRIPNTAVVVLSPRSLLGTIGTLAWSINAGVSFTVVSTSVLDLSVVRYAVFV